MNRRSLEYGIVLILSLLSPMLMAAEATVCEQLAKTGSPETFNSYQPAKVSFESIYADDSLRDFRPAIPEVIRLDNELRYRATIGAPSDGVDFNEEHLLLVFIGPRSASGYIVKVDRILRLQDGSCKGHLYVYVSEKKPATINRTASTNHPYAMIKIDRKASPVNVAQIHLITADHQSSRSLPATESEQTTSPIVTPPSTPSPSVVVKPGPVPAATPPANSIKTTPAPAATEQTVKDVTPAKP